MRVKQQQIVEVYKIDLKDGEELGELPGKIIQALGRFKTKLSRSLILTHIYKDHVITLDCETRKKFRLSLSRDENGNIQLGEPEEVKAVFVPIKNLKKDEGGSEDCEPEYLVDLEIEKADFWGGKFSLK